MNIEYMCKTNIAIVDDDIDWLKSLVGFLKGNSGFEIVWTANSRESALLLHKSLDADIVLMDINLNNVRVDGIHTVIDMLEIKQTKIIMMTSLPDSDIIIDAFTAGAANYIMKENYINLPGIITNLMNNKSPIELLAKEYVKLKRNDNLTTLSPSEKELFDHIERGYSYSQIGDILYKTRNTIKSQIKSIFKKLNAKNSNEAIYKVKRSGLKNSYKNIRSEIIDENTNSTTK